MNNRHFCNGEKDFYKKLLSDDFYIEQQDSGWYLTLRTIADAQCVRDEQAKFVGELMHSVSHLIRFCPLCGLDLKGTN